MSNLGFERKTLPTGEENSKYVDLLEEDKPISGQKFVCVSFVSPENILKQKNEFFFQEFLKEYELKKSVEKFTQFLNFMSFKYNLNFDATMEDFQQFLKSEKDEITDGYVRDEYKTFLDKHEERLTDEFNVEYNFQTSTRGLKVRGSYSTQEEAEIRAKLLREVDPNHNVYVGPVGMWMPFEPDAYKTGRVEYLEEELNQLMSEKNKNEASAKQQFEKRIKDAKKEAIENNKKLAKEHKNKLTQNVDKEGNLVGVNNTIDSRFNEKVSSSEIRQQLFETDNVRTRDDQRAKLDELKNKKV